MDQWEITNPNPEKEENATLEDYLKLFADGHENSGINTVVILLVYVPVFLVAFFGNLIVLLVILTDSRMRKSTANYFLVNLAITDLLEYSNLQSGHVTHSSDNTTRQATLRCHVKSLMVIVLQYGETVAQRGHRDRSILDSHTGQAYWTDKLDRYTGQTNWTGILDRHTGQAYWTDKLDRHTGQTHWTGILDRQTGQAYWTDKLDRHTGQTHWTGILDRHTGQTNLTGILDRHTGQAYWTDKLDR
ncbi:hypothetical protein Btru_026618 [Bulinus truncatus]|nr:hypothetical protein Btru_026618 [Bulinus truncatus]